MKKFNHIDEIWEALETCKTVEEIYDYILKYDLLRNGDSSIGKR
jgi:hypothetical protein